MGSDICPGLVSWAALRKKTGFFEILSFVVSCRHCSFSYLFSLIPALQHWLLSHQMENMPHRHKIQPGSLTSPQACRKGDQKAPLALQSSSHKAETRGMSTASSPTTLPGLQGNGCNSHWGELEYPVAGHHNLGRVGLSISCASKKAKNSFLDPGPSTNDTMGSLQLATATSPLLQPQRIPSTPSSTRFSLPMQIQCICTPHQAAELPLTSHCDRRKEQDRYVAPINVRIHVMALQKPEQSQLSLSS